MVDISLNEGHQRGEHDGMKAKDGRPYLGDRLQMWATQPTHMTLL